MSPMAHLRVTSTYSRGESIETTHVYLEADLELKQRVLSKTAPPGSKPSTYKPDDALMAFLKNL